MDKCPICKGEDGCKGLDIPLGASRYTAAISADEWKRIYYFQKYIWYPFLHGILEKAWKRKKEK